MIHLKKYIPDPPQVAFHYAIQNLYRFVAMICGIRGGKTYCGAREAGKQAWNSKAPENAVYGIIAPTFNMLDRTTWREFKIAMRGLITKENSTKKIIILKDGREVHGYSAEDADKIRNVTLAGFWVDEARECKDFAKLWDVLLGRVLSTGGKGIVTTSPNSYDDVHDIFMANRKNGYGVIRSTTYDNTHLDKSAIDDLASKYDEKFMQQELMGQFVIFEGAVYYTFDRRYNAGDLALKVAQYDPNKSIGLCCDFNIDPMAWVLTQFGINVETKLKEIYAIDEIYIKNCNTLMACQEFKNRYRNHNGGVVLYGDATGRARHTSSNVTNWKIIEDELRPYGITTNVPVKNPAERDRINAVNGVICNSLGQRRTFVNPAKCPKLIRDFEQVAYKKGSTQIDKTKDLSLTHPSDGFGYMVEKEFSLNRSMIEGLKI